LGDAVHAPVLGLHVPTLQSSPTLLQSTGVPFLQVFVTVLHFSTPLHALPSSHTGSVAHGHAVGSATQPPFVSLQLSTVQAMPSSQTTAVPPHAPAVQTSNAVHTRPSLQAVPSVIAGSVHCPVFASHFPATWH
jgi:hypothetical protein